MKRSAEILKKAFDMYTRRQNYCYFYGAKGETMTETRMNKLIASYPDFWKKYTPEEIASIKKYSMGKIGLDCSGFITKISEVSGYSASLYNKCTDKTTPRDGKAGYLLYKPGHVGIDIGYGFEMDIAAPGQTIQITKISGRGFTGSGALPGFDYSEAVNY